MHLNMVYGVCGILSSDKKNWEMPWSQSTDQHQLELTRPIQ